MYTYIQTLRQGACAEAVEGKSKGAQTIEREPSHYLVLAVLPLSHLTTRGCQDLDCAAANRLLMNSYHSFRDGSCTGKQVFKVVRRRTGM